MCARRKDPFEYTTKEEFHENLVEWIGDVLYDILPEQGYEVRDEQIYTAFQIADAMCEKKVHFAEAGLGTGKTFAYLLSAIPYARFTKKPVVVACASTALQSQLASDRGDIITLSKKLGLDVDVRMAKDPNQFICDVRVTENTAELGAMSKEINEWLDNTKYGERSEIPTIPDHIWKKIKWEESMPCDICMNRGYCKLVKAREHYRAAADLIVVDHETFFHDLWTREERIANGQLPILPHYSAVIFDEGHKVLLPAMMQAGQQVSQEEMDTMIATITELQGARESFVTVATSLEHASNDFFLLLEQSVVTKESSNRLTIRRNEPLLRAALLLRKLLDRLLLELQIEQELYMESLSSNEIQAFEGQMERTIWALTRFLKYQSDETVVWVEEKDKSLWVVPKNVGEMLDKQLYQKGLPVIFTSATLSNNGDFDYSKRTLGCKEATGATIGSPFDLENKVEVSFLNATKRIESLVSLLMENGGRTLVLTNSMQEVKKIRRALSKVEFPFEILWEDKGERGYLIQRFREEETTVLVGANFWEGIDVPGDALTLVVIWQLPFALNDPIIDGKRQDAKKQGLDPLMTVEYPEMGLKLKQGCGRLIRTEKDHGRIVLFDDVKGKPWEPFVLGALPREVK